MEFQSIDSCFDENLQGNEVKLRGWVHRLRVQKNYVFLTLRDTSGIIQCVFPYAEQFKDLTRESSVELSGTIRPDSRSPGGYELQGLTLETVGLSDEYPISKDFSVDFLNTVRHLWNRSTKMQNIMKIKSTVMISATEWFNNNNWYQTTPPIINRSACEGGSTLFEVDYFGERAFLSQSAQLYLEALIFSLEKVWSATPSFRAEKSKTPRHLAEYTHLEGEAAWMDFEDILSVEEQLLTYIAHQVAEKNYRELENLRQDPKDLSDIKTPYDRMSYYDAIKFVNKKGIAMKFGDDFGTNEERLLTLDLKQPIFLIGAPVEAKPFYTKIDPSDPKMVLSADVLAPRGYGEVSTGGQREDDLQLLEKRIRSEGFDTKDYSWYLDLRRYGSVPHAGFGFGVERLMRWMAGVDHIRDVTPFPRTLKISYP